MTTETEMKNIQNKIRLLRETAEDLKKKGEDFPALYRNVSRVLASVKMLELNVPEV